MLIYANLFIIRILYLLLINQNQESITDKQNEGENLMQHPKNTHLSLLSEEGLQLDVFLSEGRLNTFLTLLFEMLFSQAYCQLIQLSIFPKSSKQTSESYFLMQVVCLGQLLLQLM